jgi:membrane associated rhomboid family serine protease
MSEAVPPSPPDPLEAILRLCAAAAPKPWRPDGHARAAGLSAEEFDECLEDLTLDGLVRKAEGTPEAGSGLTLTPRGAEVLNDPAALRRLRDGRAVVPGDRGCVVREAVRRETPPVVTRALLAANVIVFVSTLLLARPDPALLREFLWTSPLGGGGPAVAALVEEAGGISGVGWAAGEYWRLATACFVHVGLFHLLINMVALYRVGAEVERMWGRGRYLVLYAFAGLGGSCLGVALRPQDVLAGASGALCGVVAAAAVWRLCNGRCLPRAVAREMTVNLIINGVLITFISLTPGVSGWGHLGGALAGAAAALALQVQRFGPRPWRWVAPLALVPLAGLGWAFVEYRRTTGPEWAPFRAAAVPRHAPDAPP